MISHSKRFIFIHVPKTGGTSLASALRRHGCVLQGTANYESIYFKHAYAFELKQKLGEDYYAYATFSVVRNPWEWVVSNYAFNRGLHHPWIRGTDYEVSAGVPSWAAGWSFKEWVRWWLDTLAPQQSRMLTSPQGELLVDHILRFETLAKDFSLLCSLLGLETSQLPHEMSGPARGSYLSYYDAESWNWVEVHFQEDIERFSYSWVASLGPSA